MTRLFGIGRIRDRRFRITLVLLGSLLAIALWGLQVNTYLNPADDSGRYMVLGLSMSRTGDLRLINAPRPVRDTLYPPGYPAGVAACLRVTGMRVAPAIILTKCAQALMLIAMLPLVFQLATCAGLGRPATTAAVLLVALSPGLTYYANGVMSELPFTFLCVGSVCLVERRAAAGADREPACPAWKRIVALVLALASFLVRTAGIALLVAQVVWFWRRFGFRWSLAALTASGVVVGAWMLRNRRVIETLPPRARPATYLDQFTLRDPLRPGAGRIDLNAAGIWERLETGVPKAVALVPRSFLFVASRPGSAWFRLFYVLCVAFAIAVFAGFLVALRRHVGLTTLFAALFFVLVALWPWYSPRFLVPLVPMTVVFAALGAELTCAAASANRWRVEATAGLTAAGTLLFVYLAHVQARIIRDAHPAGESRFAYGRTSAEAGFYAACAWLRSHSPAGSLIMGRPAYLLFLFSGRPTTQIEPDPRAKSQEINYVRPQHVKFLVQDAWWWAHTDTYIGPYLNVYANRWRLIWTDPLGSSVRIWERLDSPARPGVGPAGRDPS